MTVDNAISLITQHGPGAYLAKVDVKSAFRTCPVRREDWSLLGIEWDGKYYFERVLPFGLRSSPFIFNTVADALEWILQNKFCLPAILHYLDDYLNVCADPFWASSWTLPAARRGYPQTSSLTSGTFFGSATHGILSRRTNSLLSWASSRSQHELSYPAAPLCVVCGT